MSFAPILQAFRKYKVFIIATHVNSDPDALSSQLAIALYLKAKGKKVFVLSEDVVPARYAFLPESHLIKKVNTSKAVHYDAAIVVDCGDLARVGPIQKVLDPKKPLINIDHHITNDSFGTINHVVPKASSTAEVIFDLFEAAHFKINKKIAALLYLGIMTDTGSFRYENTTSRTHEVISRLLKFDIPVNTYYQRLYETVPLTDLMYFTKIVSSFHSYFGGEVIYIALQSNLMKKFSEEFDLRDKIFRYLRAIKGAEVIIILTEHGKNKTRANFRSQGRVNVARLAAIFNGGGHTRASGCVIDGNIIKAKESILDQLKKVLDKKP